MTKAIIGIIGGSGLYDVPGLEDQRWETVSSPWGAPSDDLLFGRLSGVDLVFLPRHGRGHRYAPSTINYRANIHALKSVGVTDILSFSACGSFREHLPPGQFVLVDQFIDRTFAREKSFFGTGMVAHVSMAHPVCPGLGDALEAAAKDISLPIHRGGTYLAMEGPQFSTEAESHMYRAWGCDVIGMTNMPEAKLAREAEIPYATVAMVTDFDCWHDDHDNVEVSTVIGHLNKNADNARKLLSAVVPKLGPERTPSPLGIETCLDTALITAPDIRDRSLMMDLEPILKRVLGGRS